MANKQKQFLDYAIKFYLFVGSDLSRLSTDANNKEIYKVLKKSITYLYDAVLNMETNGEVDPDALFSDYTG